MGAARSDSQERSAATKRDQCQARVEGNVTSQGQAIGSQHAQQADSAGAGGEPEQSSGQREQGGLDEHFAYHVPPARAQRLPHGQFLGSATGADQKQVVRLTAPISRRASAPACINSRVGRIGCDVVGMQGHHHGTKAGIGHHFGLGVVRFQRGILRVDLRLRLRKSGARFKPGNHMGDISPGMPLQRACDLQGCDAKGKYSRASEERKRKPGGKTPTTVVGKTVHANLPANDVGVGVEALPPIGVGENRDDAVGLIGGFLLRETASHHRAGPKGREKIRRYSRDLLAFR